MIKHVVLFNIKVGTSQKQIDAMVAGYIFMKDVIPELLSWSMGLTCAPTASSLTPWSLLWRTWKPCNATSISLFTNR